MIGGKFAVDWCIPKTLDDIAHNKRSINFLKNLTKEKTTTNILLYGPDGSGKQTIARLFMNMYYGIDMSKITGRKRHVITSCSNKQTTYHTPESRYHVEINPTGKGGDKYMVCGIISEFIEKMYQPPLWEEENELNKRKIIIIKNFEKVSSYVQNTIKSTLESNTDKFMFILITNDITSVEDAIKSRCMTFPINIPTMCEKIDILCDITTGARKYIKLSKRIKLLQESTTVSKLLWNTQLYYMGMRLNGTYGECIDSIMSILTSNKQYFTKLQAITPITKKIMTTKIELNSFIYDITKCITHSDLFTDKQKMKVIETTIQYDHTGRKCRHDTVNITGFIMSLITHTAR